MSNIKKLVILVLSCMIMACSTDSSNKSQNNIQANLINGAAIGGWAPVFFTKMDNSSLNQIADGLNSKRIDHVVISYPTKMSQLANQIHNYLLAKTHQDIPLQSIELKDTDQVKYDLSQVILTLYFSN